MDKKVKRGGKHRLNQLQSMERSENPFIPCDLPVLLPLQKLFLIMSRVGKLRSGGESERMEERDGKNLSFKESIINSLVQIRSI